MFVAIIITVMNVGFSFATNRTSVASGNWNVSSTWSPAGSPAPADNVTIAAGHTITVNSNQTVHHVTVNAGATLTWATANTLSITGSFTVNGTVTMSGGNINLTNNGGQFNLGSNSSFTWEPGTNTAATATLFTNGVESFSPTSTLIIKKWYNMAVPLPSVVTGNFGNLELNSYNGSAIPEWNQNNGFQLHQIIGTLSIDMGWITLDKSGSITNTTIGKIILKNVNSTLYAHNGTHPSSFTLNTSSITNNGGIFYGISDGNGNTTVHVTGNFINTGNVKIINNSGMAGVSNGNATFTVDSTYSQITGDTRIIYNVSTTNSGLYTATFRNVNLTGGIFMGQSACRTTGGLCSLSIAQDLTINFQNNTDKFRATSISSIGASKNAVQLNMTIGRNFSVAGVLASEVTSSAASGREDIMIGGTTTISGSNVNFNYGAPTAAHTSTLNVGGNIAVTGGMTFLSRNNGVTNITLNGNLSISAGQLSLKGGDSITTMELKGTFTQTGGQFYIHNNSSAAATVPFNVTFMNDFSQSSGTFNFDSNPSSTSANHNLFFTNANFTVSGNAVITHAGSGVSTAFGILNFQRYGTINYNRSSTSATLTQVKQVIANHCIVKVMNGNFLAASYPTPINDLIKVQPGGKLNLMSAQILSNGTFPNSFITLDSNATLMTQRPQGLYDGTASGAINSNMNFNLHPFSTVEYDGSTYQTLTGIVAGAQPVQNQYGILRINMSSVTAKATLNNVVTVRTKLILASGELNLAGNELVIGNGSSTSIARTSGYINNELGNGISPGKVTWKNMSGGMHEFPFGTNASTYIPIQLFLSSGAGADVSASTYSTASTDNLPLPVMSGLPVNFAGVASTFTNSEVIDRWWIINAPGVTAGLTLSYRGSENTIDSSYQNGPVGFIKWTGTAWASPASAGMGTTSGIGIVSSEEVSDFSAFAISRQTGARTASNLASFYVEQVGEKVSINWSTERQLNIESFSVERSADGTNFEEVSREDAAGTNNSVLHYSAIDKNPISGKSFYRIKQNGKDRSSIYSGVQEITFSVSQKNDLSIESFGPNPFDDKFNVNYKLGKVGDVRFELSSSSGQLIHQSAITETEGLHQFEYTEGSKLQTGIYFLKIIYNGKSFTEKLVKK